MGRSPCCDENGLKKGPWTPEEDQKLTDYIQKHGHGSWRALPKLAGLNRCGKSCRLRWTNYLRPDIKRGKFSQEEEKSILHLHSILGNKWSAIATHLPGRTDNEIKNFWNTHLKKKLIQMGFDPMTHKPRTDLFSTLPQLLALANIRDILMNGHHTQYPSSSLDEHAIRLQAEAVQVAKLHYLQHFLNHYSTSLNSLAGTATTPYVNSGNNIPEIEATFVNSLPTLKEEPIIPNNSLDMEINNSSDHELFSLENTHDKTLPQTSNLVAASSDLQLPNNVTFDFDWPHMSNNGGITDQFDIANFPSPSSIHISGTETSFSNTGENPTTTTSSPSSYGGGSNYPWAELFADDSIINRLPS